MVNFLVSSTAVVSLPLSWLLSLTVGLSSLQENARKVDSVRANIMGLNCFIDILIFFIFIEPTMFRSNRKSNTSCAFPVASQNPTSNYLIIDKICKSIYTFERSYPIHLISQ